MLFYRAALPLSRQTLDYVAGVIRRHRAAIGSVWRRLNPGRQALLVLAYLRKGETFGDLGAGFEVSTTTAWRYVEEAVELLAARSPDPRKALRRAKTDGHAYLILDGTRKRCRNWTSGALFCLLGAVHLGPVPGVWCAANNSEVQVPRSL